MLGRINQSQLWRLQSYTFTSTLLRVRLEKIFMESLYTKVSLNLQGEDIRLVELVDAPTVALKFHCFPLAESPAYTALSYTWGKGKNEKTISVDGCSVVVRRNLWDFLSQMRDRQEWGRLFWIDALSIDQSSTEERNHQVKLMADIYSGVWLYI